MSGKQTETERLAALTRYRILDTEAEAQFDDIVQLAAMICGVPISLISLVDEDRQWFKARVGLDATQTARDISACQYAITQDDVTVVPDTYEDPRFDGNPLVTGDPHMRFYAGAPLTTPDGHRIGTLCVLDTMPRELTLQQQFALEVLSRQVITTLDLRLKAMEADDLREAARLASEQIELALDSGAVLGTWMWEVPADRVHGDERFAQTFGLDPERLRDGVPIADAFAQIHPADSPRVQDLVAQALDAGSLFRAEYRIRQGAGWVWVEATGRIDRDAGGRVLRFPGVITDIDERKHVELRLAETQEQLELAQKAGGIGVFSLDIEADRIVASPELCRIYGIDNAVSLAAGPLERQRIPEDRDSTGTQATRRAGTAPRVAEFRIRRENDGAIRWISRRAEYIRDETGQPVMMVGVVQDVTDDRLAALQLSDSEARLSLMFESAHEYAIISVGPGGLITSWSAGAERTFGGAPAEMIGQPFAVIFTPEDRENGVPQKELDGARDRGRSNDERWHLRTDGTRFYANGVTSAMYDDHDGLSGFIKIARDMTRERQAQDNLVRARDAAEVANVAKTEFLANMSHEIRTPMNAIMGLSNLLSMSQPLTPRQREFIKTLQSSADGLLVLINDLLDISKIEARSVDLEEIPFNLTKVVQEVASMMAVRVREKGLRFSGEGDCVRERTFLGDPTRLRQIIVNLCSNAIKFTDAGHVHVGITCHATDDASVERICIAVSDTGVGIAADKLGTIFQKFTQADASVNRRFGGTGLGLAISRTLAEIMGGDIAVTSEEGRGSTFTVCLPLRLAPDQAAFDHDGSVTHVIEEAVGEAGKGTVLLVEDYEPNILVAVGFLEGFGYTVRVAKNGIEAFEMAKSDEFIAALMDVQMHGMNGLEATQTIRAYEARHNRPRLPIVGMTAHALSGDRERCLAAGMDDYLSKPFHPEQLQAVLRRVVQG